MKFTITIGCMVVATTTEGLEHAQGFGIQLARFCRTQGIAMGSYLLVKDEPGNLLHQSPTYSHGSMTHDEMATWKPIWAAIVARVEREMAEEAKETGN